jgi:hypothetical protein
MCRIVIEKSSQILQQCAEVAFFILFYILDNYNNLIFILQHWKYFVLDLEYHFQNPSLVLFWRSFILS